MELVNDFFNKLVKDIDTQFFPDVKYFRDDKNCAYCHYTIEMFNNGCLTYDTLIKRLAKKCKTTSENIIQIVDKYLIEPK